MASIRSSIARCAVVTVVTILAYVVLPLRGDHTWVGIVLGLLLVACSVPILVRVVSRVNTSDRPVAVAAAFLVALGTLALVIPAATYVVTEELAPGSFDGLETKVDGIYFTVTTASTVGYGDIHAVSQGARLLVTAHILVSIAVLGSMFRLVTRVAGGRFAETRRGMRE